MAKKKYFYICAAISQVEEVIEWNFSFAKATEDFGGLAQLATRPNGFIRAGSV